MLALPAGLLGCATSIHLANAAGSGSEALFADEGARARWLAGLEPFPGLAPSEEWTAYASAENGRWLAGQGRLKAMRDWSAREVSGLVPTDYSVFYPFAGPDALHALALFAGARRLFLVGLEPVGALPDPAKPLAPGYFSRLGAALADIHRLTFFRTLEMSTDFQREGVLSALVATVARMGGVVTSVRTSGAATSTSGPSSVRIDWETPQRQRAARRLDYTQVDLANAGLQRQAAFVATAHGLAPHVTFMKAAMYLLAEPRFSMLRQMILDDASVLLQDDTGLPFRYLDERWASRLYGRYETPGAPYEGRHQPTLRAAFESGRPPPLPFGIGYHMQAGRSNLLLASKGRR